MNNAGIPDVPIQVPVDDPQADTEWNDILRTHGVLPPKPPSPTKEIEAALVSAVELAHASRLEGKDLSELDELEDLEDEDFLASYREKRLAELDARQKAPHGSVYPLQKAEYAREVTEASQRYPVLVLMTGSGAESKLMERLWPELARRWPETKFCLIKADMCVEGYPERNCPTVLAYRDGDLRRQLVTMAEIGGAQAGRERVERWLVEAKVIDVGDLRLRKENEDEDGEVERARRGKTIRKKEVKGGDDDDSDWD